MRKKAGIIGNCVIIMIVGLVACGIQGNDYSGTGIGQLENVQSAKNSSRTENHISVSISEDVKIDADIENNEIKNCIVYKTTGKEFDIGTIKEIFWTDTSDLVQEENGIFQITDTEGRRLAAEAGRLDYESKEGMADLAMLVKYCFWDKISNVDTKKLETIGNEAAVANAVEQLRQIYTLGDGEELCLQQGVKISMSDVIKCWKEMKDNMKAETERNKLTQNCLGKNAYYLCYIIKKQGICMTSDYEPGFLLTNGNLNLQATNVEMIVDENGIEFLSIRGAFELEESKNEEIITVQEAAQYIKSEYNGQGIEESIIFDSVWLEYTFISSSFYDEDYNKGTLEPYWIFVDSKNDIVERINAITGDNFRY